MWARIKQYFWIALVVYAFYYLLSHHFIIFHFDSIEDSFETLKKAELTFTNTFFSLKTNTPEQALRNEVLRDAGIGDLMIERGLISRENLEALLLKIDSGKK